MAPAQPLEGPLRTKEDAGPPIFNTLSSVVGMASYGGPEVMTGTQGLLNPIFPKLTHTRLEAA